MYLSMSLLLGVQRTALHSSSLSFQAYVWPVTRSILQPYLGLWHIRTDLMAYFTCRILVWANSMRAFSTHTHTHTHTHTRLKCYQRKQLSILWARISRYSILVDFYLRNQHACVRLDVYSFFGGKTEFMPRHRQQFRNCSHNTHERFGGATSWKMISHLYPTVHFATTQHGRDTLDRFLATHSHACSLVRYRHVYACRYNQARLSTRSSSHLMAFSEAFSGSAPRIYAHNRMRTYAHNRM